MTEKSKENNFQATTEVPTNARIQSTLAISSKDVKDEKEYNPFDHRHLEHPNSVLGSIAHLLKACMGSGILAMPAAFKNAGLIAGVIGTMIAGFVCTYSIHMLVKTSQNLCIEAKKPLMGYAETCGAAFTYGPKKLQKFGPAMKLFADVAMSLTYLGVLSVFVVFIGTSLKTGLDDVIATQMSVETYCALTLVPLVVLCQIRNLKYLVPCSMTANFLITVVFAITLYYIFSDLPSLSEVDRVMVAPVAHWPLFLSTVIFAMEGVGVVMPVENEMRNPEKFLGCPGVLNVSMVIVIFMYGLVGYFGYLKYGDVVKGSVTLNLPDDTWIAKSAQLLMAVVIYLSYALQFYVPMEMINRLIPQIKSSRYEQLIQIGIRTVLVTLTVAIAAAFPNLELVISLVGAVFLSTLGLLIPAIIDTVYNWDRGLGVCYYVLWKNVLIGLISLTALISGSYSSINKMILEFGSHEHVSNNSTMSYH